VLVADGLIGRLRRSSVADAEESVEARAREAPEEAIPDGVGGGDGPSRNGIR
jgi:hypothetical protein